MDAVKHTPGPWYVYPTEYDNDTESFDVMADGAAITIACPPSEADARLIAAAPDLLAACEQVLSRLDYLTELWGQEGVTRGVQDALRAALAKAKGGA